MSREEERDVASPVFGVGDDGPAGSSPAEIRAALGRQRKPDKPTEYDVEEGIFWATRHIPPGSVVEFTNPYSTELEAPLVAVLVTEAVSQAEGMWLKGQLVGAATDSERKEASRYFKGAKGQVHICYLQEGVCPLDESPGLHITKFKWFPPGDFQAEYLTTHGKRLVKKGQKMQLEYDKAGRGAPPEAADAGKPPEASRVEQRLGALRRRSGITPRVTFAGDSEPAPTRRGDAGLEVAVVGTGGRAPPSSSLAGPRERSVKVETLEVSDATESDHPAKNKKKAHRDLGQTLVKAAKVRTVVDQRKSKRRSRSRSRSRRRKRRERRHSGSGSRSSSSRRESSSEESLMAPLKKRSQKSPGSVYQMLEETAVQKLSADGIVEEGYEAAGLRGQRPKILTYFQLCLKPLLDTRGRDCKELAVLARSLDLLREGRLAELADVLAGRLVAIDTATRQGWSTARHLEVYCEDEDGSAPAHVLLAAQRHARQVEKAGGKGSWPRSAPWNQGDWGYDSRDKGRGKGGKNKGKKGKPKGKGQKGAWTPRYNENQDKTSDKGKKGDAET